MDAWDDGTDQPIVLSLVMRRAVAQRRLLAGVIALVTLGTTLLGVGALLLGVTQDRAFATAVQAEAPPDVDVTAFLVGLKGSDQVEVRDAARSVVENALRPLRPTVTVNAVSRMRRLADSGGIGYLSSTDSLSTQSALTSGRWPEAPGEAVVLDKTATHKGFALGSRIALGKEIGTAPVDNEVSLVVVGTFRPATESDWQADPLEGSGFDAAYSDGTVKAPAFGPLVVDDATFRASGSTVDAMQVTGNPALDHATAASLDDAARAVKSAGGVLSNRTGGKVQISRVASDLPQTLAELRAQESATRSMVLIVLVLCTTLALTALFLAGRLLSGVRETERGLLAGFGLARRQQVVLSLAETLLVAVAASAIALPAAALTHAAITHLPAMAAAGLSQSPRVTVELVLTVFIGAVLLAVALVMPALSPPRPGRRIAVAARSGTDVLLAGIAVGAWWQLHSQSSATAPDTTRTLAPVVFVAAIAALTVRVAPLLLGLVAKLAARQTSLTLPLATSQAARRPYAGAALLLLAMATASATFGLTLQSTSDRSAQDQAALTVGADLTLELTGPATDQQGAAIAAATKGDVASAVVNRSLALGRYVGDDGKPPQLVAVDTRQAGDLLRGRLDRGRTWSDVGAKLAPGKALDGPALSADGVTIQGDSSSSVPAGVEVTPTLVVQDATGFRRTVTADSVPLDGRPHHLGGLGNLEGARLIATRLSLNRSPGSTTGGTATLEIRLSLPQAARDAGSAKWEVQTLDADQSPVVGSAVTVEKSSRAITIQTTAQVDLQYLTYTSGDLLESAFETPAAVPVAVSQQLVDTVGVKVGGELTASVAGVSIPLEVAAIVPDVPSAPGRVAVLADADALSRVLIGAGTLEPVVDAWWVADPKSGTAHTLGKLELGDVTTRTGVAADLVQGPLRASFPAALSLLVGAAIVLLLAGAALVLGTEQGARSAEVARLRAMGLPRPDAIRLLLAEHGILLGLLILAGALVGAVTSLALGPSLIRSDVGGEPVPTAVLEWPWLSEVLLVTGLLVGCLVIASVISVVAVQRSGSAQLRTADA